jgi:hypothetical protein
MNINTNANSTHKPKKIIIFGFPHSGTSILKSILGHIDDVEEIIEECNWIDQSSSKKYILCKYPFTEDDFFMKKYCDYIKIFIIRNPFYVFSSLNKRYGRAAAIPYNTSIIRYIWTCQKYLECLDHPPQNTYIIKYEDIFPNHFAKLKKILNAIGVSYSDRIFDNTKYKNQLFTDISCVTQKPPNNDHKHYRTWQINQPLRNNNDPSQINLTPTQIQQLTESSIVLQLYPNVCLLAEKVHKT